MSLFDSNRGRIPPPELDDRVWKDIVDQATALIPKYAPQWTDHGPSDIGITLIELFAWLVEGLIYRLNQVPEKNYLAFLNLLGITRNPPEPARAFLTFFAARDGVELQPGVQAQTAGNESEPPIVFETDEHLSVLPINLYGTALIGPALLTGTNLQYTNVSTAFAAPPPGEVNSGTLAVPRGQGKRLDLKAGEAAILCLGFLPVTTPFNPARPVAINLMIRLSLPLQKDKAKATWLHSSGGLGPLAWDEVRTIDGTGGLQHDGNVQLTVPTDWEQQAPPSWGNVAPASEGDKITQGYYWIGLKVMNTTQDVLSVGLDWILFNAVSSHSALTIASPEQIGRSDGRPFQVFALANGPLYRQPGQDPYSHLVILVDGTRWVRVDDPPDGEGAVFRLDPVAAEISFGNFSAGSGHGSIPPADSTIVAQTYRYIAAGAAANVRAGAIVALCGKVDGINRVTNVAAAYGGADQESIDDTKRRAPQLLRNRNRAVSREDYEFLAMQSSTELATVRCLDPKYGSDGVPWTYSSIDRSAGNVNLIVVPKLGLDISAIKDPAPELLRPQPTPELIQTVVSQLDRQRDVATRLNVRGPLYLQIDVTIKVVSFVPATLNDLKEYIEPRVRQYLHPVVGGLDGKGWQVGQHVYALDLLRAITLPIELGYISDLKVTASTLVLATTAAAQASSKELNFGPTTAIMPGMSVSGPNIPAGTTVDLGGVTATSTGTTVKLNQAVTGTGVPVNTAITFVNPRPPLGTDTPGRVQLADFELVCEGKVSVDS